ncbi:tryptase-2-like, partial [Argonauta hians]
SSKRHQIVNGDPIPQCRTPWIVNLIIFRSRNYRESFELCGGTLIDNSHILTAAHCVLPNEDGNVIRLKVNLATDDPSNPVYTILARSYNYYHQYTFNRYGIPYNDIATVKLASPVRYSKCLYPISLPDQDELFTGDCWALGWGANGYDQSPSASLQIVKLPIVSTRYCPWPGLVNSQMCAGQYSAWSRTKGICTGDSGGPLVCEKDGRPVLAGLASYGNCGRKPGIFTKVSSFVNWIYRNLN